MKNRKRRMSMFKGGMDRFGNICRLINPMIEPITTHRWSTDGCPFAALGVRVEELARRLGVSLQEWNVDGLGLARGFGFRVPSGRVW